MDPHPWQNFALLTPVPAPAMKRCLLGIILLFAAGMAGPAFGDDLPTGLQLPPRPQALLAQVAPHRVPAGLPGGPAPVFVPNSHLTLPAKPVLAQSPAGVARPAPPVLSDFPSDAPLPLIHPADPGSLSGLLPSPSGLDSVPGDELPFPDGSLPPPPDSSSADPGSPAPPGPDSGSVPSSDLRPGPQSSAETSTEQPRGPLFRVTGAEAFIVARQRGFRFTPAHGLGLRDGNHTVASQVPHVLTSEVHGTRMMQMRPSPLWTSAFIENTFYMFCDAAYNAVKLQPGWKVRGIRLQGPDWAWVACPRSGANTVSFSIRIRSWKRPDAPAQGTVVTLRGLTLEGPPGATDWKAAFPNLKQPAGMAARK